MNALTDNCANDKGKLHQKSLKEPLEYLHIYERKGYMMMMDLFQIKIEMIWICLMVQIRLGIENTWSRYP
jgi:hypothetical protein